MRIHTKVTWDIHGNVIEDEWHEYDGPVALCGGGPSQEQKDAAAAQAQNSQVESQAAQVAQQRQTDAYNSIKPYATNLMQNGDPYFGAQSDYAGGNVAKAYDPARGALNRQLSSIGSLPSGFKTSQMADLNENEAQAYDSGLQSAQENNNQMKMQGANMINGLQSTYNPNSLYATSNSANSSIMNAPLQSPGAMGVIGGLIGAGAQLGSAYLSGGATTAMCPARGSLYLMADGTEKPVEELVIGDRLMGIEGEPQTIKEIQIGSAPVLRVMTDDRAVGRVSRVHAFALPLGGFTVATHSVGKMIRARHGTAHVLSVVDDGTDDVFNVITGPGSHTYRADGLWALGVSEAEYAQAPASREPAADSALEHTT